MAIGESGGSTVFALVGQRVIDATLHQDELVAPTHDRGIGRLPPRRRREADRAGAERGQQQPRRLAIKADVEPCQIARRRRGGAAQRQPVGGHVAAGLAQRVGRIERDDRVFLAQSGAMDEVFDEHGAGSGRSSARPASAYSTLALFMPRCR